jgi:hypothetical protein
MKKQEQDTTLHIFCSSLGCELSKNFEEHEIFPHKFFDKEQSFSRLKAFLNLAD